MHKRIIHIIEEKKSGSDTINTYNTLSFVVKAHTHIEMRNKKVGKDCEARNLSEVECKMRSIMRQIKMEPKESVSGQSHEFTVMHRPVNLEDR